MGHHRDPPEPPTRPEETTPCDGHPAGSAEPGPPDDGPDVWPDDDYEPL